MSETLLSLSREAVEQRFAELGGKPFHARIARREVLTNGVTDYAEMSGQLRRFDFTYYVDGRGLHLPRKMMSDPLVVLLSAPFEREQYQMNLVEALDQRFRNAALEIGIDPASLLARDESVRKSDPLDPEAIARSVMDQYGITPADLDDLNLER